MFRAVVFAAVSTARQASRDKLSIPDQVDRCRATLATKGWAEAHDPLVASGASRERWVSLADAEAHIPALATMFQLAEQGAINLVVAVDYNRFRGLLDQVRRTLGQYRVQLYSLNQPVEPIPPSDFSDEYSNDTSAIVSTISQITSYTQIADLRRKYARFMPQRVDVLGLPYGYLPYGYAKPAVVSSTDRVSRLVAVQVPEQCAVLLKLKDLYLKGYSGVQLEKYLKENNIPTRFGGEWKSNNIIKLISSPFYAGYVYRNKTRTKRDPRTGEKKLTYLPRSEWLLAQGKHPPLWSVDDYKRINALGEHRRARRANRSNSPSMFSLLLRCSCGRTLTINYTTTRTRHRLYRCKGGIKKGHAYISESSVYDQFRAVLKEVVERIPLATIEHGDTANTTTLHAALATNDQARSRFQHAYGKGILSEDDLSARLAELDIERTRLVAELKSYEIEGQRSQRNAARHDEAAAVLATYDSLPNLPPREANAKLSYIVDSIVVSGNILTEVNLRDD